MPSLVEYETTLVELSEAELRCLLPLVKGSAGSDEDARVLQAVTPTTRPGCYEVRSGPYVGRIGLPTGRWIDFVSRFPLDDAFRLIAYSDQRPSRVSTPPITGSPGRVFFDALASAFLAATDRVVRAGLMKGYRTRRHTRPPYGGRLDITYHLSKFMARPDRLVTVGRELTTDVASNQLLAVALDALRRMPLAHPLPRAAAALAPPFARVARPVIPARKAREIADVVPVRYRTAAMFAALIVQAQAVVPKGDEYHVPSMLFFMPPVWEAYVARWVQRENVMWRIEAGHRFMLSSNGVWARADVVAREDTGESLAGLYDAKYKWPDRAPVAADLYQMVTYCSALGLSEATLVYPVATSPRSIRVGDKTVHVVGAPPTFADDVMPWRVSRVTSDLV